jgi:hypothetical protein
MGAGLVFQLYKDNRTVYTFQEIAMLINEPDVSKLKQRINYYVRTKKIKNPRRGIYAKEGYSAEELACKIFKPSYISLEYILQKSGIVFQYNPRITAISYLSRTINIDGNILDYRKIKNDILYDSTGINIHDNGTSLATPERAFLDTLYLNKEYYFDSLERLSKDAVFDILPIYQSKELTKRVQRLF